jgi:hypothetical protein
MQVIILLLLLLVPSGWLVICISIGGTVGKLYLGGSIISIWDKLYKMYLEGMGVNRHIGDTGVKLYYLGIITGRLGICHYEDTGVRLHIGGIWGMVVELHIWVSIRGRLFICLAGCMGVMFIPGVRLYNLDSITGRLGFGHYGDTVGTHGDTGVRLHIGGGGRLGICLAWCLLVLSKGCMVGFLVGRGCWAELSW